MSAATPDRADKPGMPDRRARPASPAALAGITPDNRFAPSLDLVRAVLESARAKLRGDPDRLALLWALKAGDSVAAHFATRLLCRVGGLPSLANWLDEPCRTRREVLALLDRGLRAFGVRHSGGWRVSSSPFFPSPRPTSEASL